MIYLITGGNNTLITSDGGSYSPVAGGGSRHSGLGEGEGPLAALQLLQAQDNIARGSPHNFHTQHLCSNLSLCGLGPL